MFARLIFLLLLLALLSCPCRAQSQQPSSNPATSAKPATPPANGQPAAAQSKKPKKVWTNDDMESVKGTVSVVGDPDPTPEIGGEKGPVASTGENKVHQRQIEVYRSRIRDLRSRIDAADKRIAELKNFKAEDASPSGGLKPYHGYDMVPIEDQVKELEIKKKQLQGKIEDIENEARKNGIEPGELR